MVINTFFWWVGGGLRPTLFPVFAKRTGGNGKKGRASPPRVPEGKSFARPGSRREKGRTSQRSSILASFPSPSFLLKENIFFWFVSVVRRARSFGFKRF